VAGGIRSCSLGEGFDKVKATRLDEEKLVDHSIEGGRQHDSIIFTIVTPRTRKILNERQGILLEAPKRPMLNLQTFPNK